MTLPFSRPRASRLALIFAVVLGLLAPMVARAQDAARPTGAPSSSSAPQTPAGTDAAAQPPARQMDPAEMPARATTPSSPPATLSENPAPRPPASASGSPATEPPAAGPAGAAATASPSAAGTAAPAPAMAAPLPEPLRKDIKTLLDTLKDDQAREDFVARLNTLLVIGTPEAKNAALREDWLAGATGALSAFSGSVLTLVAEVEKVPAAATELFSGLSKPLVLERIAWAAGMVAAVLIAALVAEWIVKWLLARPRAAVEQRRGSNLVVRILLLFLRTLLDTLPIAAFAAAAFGVIALVDLNFVVRLAVVMVVNANVLARALLAAGRAVLTPNVPSLRVIRLDNESAAYCYLWLRRFTYTAVYGYFTLRAAWILGLSTAAYTMFMGLLVLIITGMAIVFILQVRRGVTRWLRGVSAPTGSVANLRNQIADFWYILAIAYVLAAYLVWLFDVPGGTAFLVRATLLSIVAIVAARLIRLGLLRMFRAIFRLNDDVRERFPLLEMRANRYLPVLKQAVQIVIFAMTGLVLLEIWGAHPFEWLASPEGQNLLGRVISISIVMLIAFLAWEIGAAFAERISRRNPTSTRLKTLLPFLQNGFRIVLMTIAGLIVLSELGVNIAPLLAGAGVLGLAIGFGAQTLVKDVITGVFILMEDTLSVGDVVELGSHSGLVEKITIRTVHLRDFDGNVHSMPFGEVQTVKNMSKQYAYAVVDVTVAYRENIDDALAVMEEVANDMAENGPLADTIIGPFEVMGVEGLQDSAVWLRGRFKTRPLGQWNVKREFYRRIKAAFDARDIEIPFPHQTIYFGVDKKGDAPPVRVVNPQAQGPGTGRRRETKSTVAESERAAKTSGPLIEELPGARERTGEDKPLIAPIED